MLYYRQARDLFEVTDIAGDDSEAELQRGGGDQQVLEGDADALRGLVTLDAPGEPAVSMVTECTGTSRISSSTKAWRRCRRSSVPAHWMPWTSSTMVTTDKPISLSP